MKTLFKALCLTILLATNTAHADAVIFSGNDVKTLKQNIDLNGQTKILSGAVDPSSVATTAPIGALYLNNSNGNLYRKLDAGSSTNWQRVGNAGLAGTIVPNPDWETNASGWTVSGGTYARTTTAADVAFGAGSGSWDASAASQTLLSTAVAIPTGLYANNGVARCSFKTAANDYVMQVFDGTNVLASTPILASAQYAPQSVNFIFPSSGNASIRIVSASDAAILYADNCYLGAADNLSQVSQAQDYGSIQFSSASCQWSIPAGNPVDLSAVAACLTTAPTVSGGVTAPATGIPGFTMASAPPGVYYIYANLQSQRSSATNLKCYIGDGTTSGGIGGAVDGTAGAVFAKFTYTSAGTRNIRIGCGVGGGTGTGNLYADGADGGTRVLQFFVARMPSSSEIAYRPDAMPASWSGYHGNDCLWTRSSTAYGDPGADASCTFTQQFNRNFGTVSSVSGSLPGIVFTPARAGRYLVCASAPFVPAANTLFNARLTDGTTTYGEAAATLQNGFRAPVQICGIEDAPNTSAQTVKLQWNSTSSVQVDLNPTGTGTGSVFWTITALDQALPAPTLVGSVTSNSTGAERVERARMATACTINGSCSITDQTGSWVSVSRTGTGSYTATFSSGIFSGAPTCVATSSTSNQGGCSTTSASSSSVTINCVAPNTTAADIGINLICMGPR